MGCGNSTPAQDHLAKYRTQNYAKDGKKQDEQPPNPNLLEASTTPVDDAAQESKMRASMVTMAGDDESRRGSEGLPEANPVPAFTQPPTSELEQGAAVKGGTVPVGAEPALPLATSAEAPGEELQCAPANARDALDDLKLGSAAAEPGREAAPAEVAPEPEKEANMQQAAAGDAAAGHSQKNHEGAAAVQNQQGARSWLHDKKLANQTARRERSLWCDSCC